LNSRKIFTKTYKNILQHSEIVKRLYWTGFIKNYVINL